MDLAKVGEVTERSEEVANEFLCQGWVLLGFVERQYTATTTRPDKSRTIYILGKPREKPKPVEEQSEEWRREHLPIDDRRHPDFFLHAKGSS